MSELRVEIDPEKVGFDPERLARIDRHFAAYVDDGRLPGWQVVLTRAGQVAYVSEYGCRDVEAGLAVERDTLFRIYSMTKPITSVAAMMLYEEGAFELKDPVSRYIPAFENQRVYVSGPAANPVTRPAIEPVRVWHLLTHTAGLTYGFHYASPVDAMYRHAGFEWGSPRDADLEAVCDIYAGFPLLFEPGTEWNYSVATDVVGRLVEVLSGQPLDEFLREQDLRAAGHGRHRVPRPRGRSRSPGRPLRPRARPPGHPDGRHGQRGEASAGDVLGRGRAGVERGRLPPLHPDAAAGRRARRRPSARPGHGGLHDVEPPARRCRARSHRPAHLLGDGVQRDGLRPRASRWWRARRRTRCCPASGSSPGAGRPAPPSGSIPSRSSPRCS